MRVLRRPLAWWLLTAAVAISAALTVGGIQAEAKRNRDAWGDTAAVLVAIEAIEPGAVIAPRVEAQRWPRALVPDGAVAEVSTDAVAITSIGEGEPLMAHRLSGTGAGLGARIPPGRRAVAVSAVLVPTGLAVGDSVDLVATFPSGAERDDGVVATASVVIDASDDQVTVAVLPDEVAATAAAISRGTLTLLVNGQ